MATLAQVEVSDQSFWQKTMLWISVFIVFGFAQFAARGLVDYGSVPLYVHAHAVVMMAWLGLTVTQATLVARDNLALHRRLGWLGAALATVVVCFGSWVSIQIIQAHREPFFFTPPFFLALTQVGLLTFAGLIVAAIARRKETEWHRRLMVGALIMLMEPALGRTLPMPLIMPWGEWAALVVQLGVLAVVARHDRKVLGMIHPATIAAGLVITLSHCIIEALAVAPFWQALTDRVIAA
ncbi:hypothetical protein KRR38_25590 [Novosphingobium sp. G106]|uniref:hypothetical protein n=1 Tax=Novosphingobium sp. G106 TaxID=2849500 RepID=UPI001C2D46B1|nr:hypothetical protein [Novosphingobium sp. G106]MBV1690959.1 hypothetical protein [Novosphingobium sp. G106]